MVALIAAVGCGILSAPLAGLAQPAVKAPRVGLLAGGTGFSDESPLLETFQRHLRDLGYFERQNILIDRRNAEGRYERLPELARALLRYGPDVIVATSLPAVQAAARATQTVPIVMVSGGDPVRSGLIADLAHPGGNITGVSIHSPEVIGKHLELLREIVPDLARVAAVANPATPATPPMLEELQASAWKLRIQVHRVEVRSRSELGTAFATIARQRVDAAVVLPDAMLFAERARLAQLAARNRLPTIYQFREFVDAGGLLAYGPNIAEILQRVAVYVERLLKGAKPADLPVEGPRKFELVINLKTAKALGLTIPPSVLLRADHVIQ